MSPADMAELRWLLAWVQRRDMRERSDCSGNGRFPTMLEARNSINPRWRGVDAYHCSFCMGWHVGNNVASRNKRLLTARRKA